MAQFVPGRDTEVKAEEPLLEVLVDAEHPLKVGKHTFQLVVTDDSNLSSEPAIVTIIVQDTARPTAVIDVVNAEGRPVPAPFNFAFGQRFGLSGKRSSDIGGTIRSFAWTLLPD
jgi:hypothetical protein